MHIDHPESLDAQQAAERFDVAPHIHPIDFIFQYKLDIDHNPDRIPARQNATRSYFEDGAYSAKLLDEVTKSCKIDPSISRPSLLEFASGYGCVSRHLARHHADYDLLACDIHPAAIEFLQDRIGIDAVGSTTNPDQFYLPRQFDIVFALSFFSHMPHATFRRWLKALFGTVALDGVLIFTTHGLSAWRDLEHPPLPSSGCWFQTYSEQKDLPVEDYGVTIVPFDYVSRCIADMPNASLERFEHAFWWGKQDLYVIRKTIEDFRTPGGSPETASQEQETLLRAQLTAMQQSTSWKITAPIRAIREWQVRRRRG